jgi:predicted Zn-dependent peptidase
LVDARKLGGASLVAGSVESEATGASMKELLAEIEGMRKAPVTPGELEVARNAIVLALPAQFATAAGIAEKLADEVIYGLPDDHWNRYADAVGKVTAEDVQRVARKLLALDRLMVVMVGRSSDLRNRLEALPIGPIEVRTSPGR